MGRRHKPKTFYRLECPYCGRECQRVGGDVIYPHRPDLRCKLFYRCEPCGAYVGTHRNSGEPLGLPANHALRAARIQAHNAFDRLWKPGGPMDRPLAYHWLADQLKMKQKDCHIGQFNIEQCRQVLAAVREFRGVTAKYKGTNHDARRPTGLDGSDREPAAAGEDADGAGAA